MEISLKAAFSNPGKGGFLLFIACRLAQCVEEPVGLEVEFDAGDDCHPHVFVGDVENLLLLEEREVAELRDLPSAGSPTASRYRGAIS